MIVKFRTMVRNINLDKSTRMKLNALKKDINVDALEEDNPWNGSNQKTATLFKVTQFDYLDIEHHDIQIVSDL